MFHQIIVAASFYVCKLESDLNAAWNYMLQVRILSARLKY